LYITCILFIQVLEQYNWQKKEFNVEKPKKLNLNQTVKMKKTVRVKNFVGKDEKMVIRVGLIYMQAWNKIIFL
jgi:hypothetical protein